MKLGTTTTRDAQMKTHMFNGSTNSTHGNIFTQKQEKQLARLYLLLNNPPHEITAHFLDQMLPAIPTPPLTCHHPAYPKTISVRFHHVLHLLHLRWSFRVDPLPHQRRLILTLNLPDPVRPIVDTHEVEHDRLYLQGYG